MPHVKHSSREHMLRSIRCPLVHMQKPKSSPLLTSKFPTQQIRDEKMLSPKWFSSGGDEGLPNLQTPDFDGWWVA